MTTERPEALRLASDIAASGQFTNLFTLDAAAAELRTQHARITELDASLAEIMKHGCTAMQSCWKRYQSVGKFGFAGPEISDVVAALDASEAITDASSPRQLIEAAHAAARHGQLFREALEP